MSMHRGFTVAGQLARRSLAACAISSLIASTALTPLSAAFAQSQQTPATQPASPGPPITAQTQAGDPPARVGRIAKINGTVSFHTADEDQWSPATLNYPLTNGNALWTEPGARAELQLGSTNRLVMDGKTELNLTTLDDSVFEANLPQGSAYVNLQDVAPDESYTIRTPRGLVQLSQPGRYAITAGDDDTPTTVTTLAGAPAQLAERGLTQSVPAGQTATLNGPLDGDDPVKVAVAPGQPSAFAQSAMAEERQSQTAAPPPPTPNFAAAPVPAPSTAPAPVPAAMPAQVQGMTGAQDLAAYGTWSSAPQYGSVWYPPVQAGWVPYRHGHWAWVPPWGWTWVADEPWGFAPFHYGRWVMVHDRWAWSPGFHHRHHHRHGHWPRPVYAPALVAFFGSSSGVSVSVAIGRDVGWVPLGWHEPYYPPYRVSRNYIRNVNVTHVTNITKVTNVTVNNTTVNRYVNRNSATFVQADTMRHSRPVQQAVQRFDDRQMQSMRSERRPQVQPERQRQVQQAPGPRIDQAALRRPEQRRDLQRQDMQRNGGQRNTPLREISRRQDQPEMQQEQARQQDRRPDRQQPQDRQRQDGQRPERQPQQVQREQQPQRDQQGRDQQRQVQQERQRPDMQRQEQQRQPQAELQRQMHQQERQRQDQRQQQMRQQADQQRQIQHQERQRQEAQRQDQQRQQMQREQQAQQQRQHQEMQRQQVQREQQMRQQGDQQRQQVEQQQQRQQVQQDQRRQQEAQSQAQSQRQQQQEPRQQRRRDVDL